MGRLATKYIHSPTTGLVLALAGNIPQAHTPRGWPLIAAVRPCRALSEITAFLPVRAIHHHHHHLYASLVGRSASEPRRAACAARRVPALLALAACTAGTRVRPAEPRTGGGCGVSSRQRARSALGTRSSEGGEACSAEEEKDTGPTTGDSRGGGDVRRDETSATREE